MSKVSARSLPCDRLFRRLHSARRFMPLSSLRYRVRRPYALFLAFHAFPSNDHHSIQPTLPCCTDATALSNRTHRLPRSTSAFLHTTFAYLLPTPLISVRAYMIFRFPSMFVFSRRRMCWKTWNALHANKHRRLSMHVPPLPLVFSFARSIAHLMLLWHAERHD